MCGRFIRKGEPKKVAESFGGKDGEGTTRQIGNIHSRKLASHPVFLHIPTGGNADCMSPINEMAAMPSSVLFLLSQQRITPAIHALAHERGIMLDSVIERLAVPDSASIQIRTMLGARSHKSTTARNLIEPILDVQTDWSWQKLKITIDPTGRITAAYGKQRQSHTFTKANKTGACRHIEILATIAVHGTWQPSKNTLRGRQEGVQAPSNRTPSDPPATRRTL